MDKIIRKVKPTQAYVKREDGKTRLRCWGSPQFYGKELKDIAPGIQRIVRTKIGSCTLRLNNRITAGTRKHPHRFMGLRTEGKGGAEQVEFSLPEDTKFLKDLPLDECTTDFGPVIVQNAYQNSRIMFPGDKILPIVIEFSGVYYEIKGQEITVFSESSKEFVLRFTKPILVDKHFRPILLEDTEWEDIDLVVTEIIENEDGSLTYTKKLTDAFHEARHLLPEIFYADAPVTYNATNTQGRMRSNSITSWAAAKAGDSKSYTDINGAANNGVRAQYNGTTWSVVRPVLSFDTDGITDTDVVVGAEVNVKGVTNNDNDVALVAFAPGAATPVANDWTNFGAANINTENGVPWVLGSFNTFTMNAANAATHVNKTGNTWVGLWETTYDQPNQAPTSGQDSNHGLYYYNGDANDPYIDVDARGIAVTSPTVGNEDYDQGTVENITWSSTGDVANVRITLDFNGDGYATELVASTTDDGSWAWNIPAGQTIAATYQIRVADAAFPGEVKDESDNDFTISARTIVVTAPDGAEEWGITKSHDITFTYSSDGSMDFVKIEFYTGAVWDELVASLGLTGSPQTWTWNPINDAQTAAAKVRITDVSTDVGSDPVWDMSDAVFDIYKVTVTAPTTTRYIGEAWDIAWTCGDGHFVGNANVDIYYSKTNAWGGEEILIDDNDPNDGAYAGTVPDDASATVWVRIREKGGETLSDVIDNSFAIMQRPTSPARSRLEAELTIDGVRQNLRDFTVTWDRENGRRITFVLPSSRRNERFSGRYAQFKHGLGGFYDGVAFKGRIKNIQESSDSVRVTAFDYTNDLKYEEHLRTADTGMSGNTISGYIYELLDNSGTTYDLTNYGASIADRFDKIKTDMIDDLKALDYKWDAVVYLLDQATNTDDWDDIITYHLMNIRWNEMSIRPTPDLTGHLLTVPAPGSVRLASDITIDSAITSCRAHSSVSGFQDQHSILYRPLWLETERGVNFRKISYPSKSPDRLWDASVRYVENRKKPQISFVIDVAKGFWIKPLMALDLSDLEEFGKAAYVTCVVYNGDLTANCEVNTRRPDLFDLLGV